VLSLLCPVGPIPLPSAHRFSSRNSFTLASTHQHLHVLTLPDLPCKVASGAAFLCDVPMLDADLLGHQRIGSNANQEEH
jgi:hypothetical protein